MCFLDKLWVQFPLICLKYTNRVCAFGLQVSGNKSAPKGVLDLNLNVSFSLKGAVGKIQEGSPENGNDQSHERIFNNIRRPIR